MILPLQTYWKSKLEITYSECMAGGEAGLVNRRRPNVRGHKVERELLDELDGWLTAMAERSPPCPSPAGHLWELNCLLYSGAVITEAMVKASPQQKVMAFVIEI